jgi:hypothetical protein
MPKKPKNDDIPDALRPYTFHGVELDIPRHGEEAIGECPFCGSTKFNVNMDTSMFKCWSGSCDESGNATTFLRKFWKFCYDQTTHRDYDKLGEESGFSGTAANVFGCAMSTLKDQWIIPGYNADGAMVTLLRYGRIKDGDVWKNRLMLCPTMSSSSLMNVQNYDPKLEDVYLFEGWRDAIAWTDYMAVKGITGNVLATTGTSHFKPGLCSLFSGKRVNVMFDNDIPVVNEKTGKKKKSAGVEGIKRVASILSSSKDGPPDEINYIAWGGDERGYTDKMKDGTDVRDYLRSKETNGVAHTH